jgi:hypothetical protein
MKNKQEEVDPIITCYIYNEDHIPITDSEGRRLQRIAFLFQLSHKPIAAACLSAELMYVVFQVS